MEDHVARSTDEWRSRGWPATRGRHAFGLISDLQHVVVRRCTPVLDELGLTWPKWETILVLYLSREGQLPLRKLAQRLTVQPGSLTGMINRLARDGLVSRVQHPTDARITLAVLTPRGALLAEEAAIKLAKVAFSMEALSSAEMDQLIQLLEKWRQGIYRDSSLPPLK